MQKKRHQAKRKRTPTEAVLYGAASSSRYREAMGYGNYRYVPDRSAEQSDNWYARLYIQRPETVGFSGEPRRRPRQRREDMVMWYEL